MWKNWSGRGFHRFGRSHWASLSKHSRSGSGASGSTSSRACASAASVDSRARVRNASSATGASARDVVKADAPVGGLAQLSEAQLRRPQPFPRRAEPFDALLEERQRPVEVELVGDACVP